MHPGSTRNSTDNPHNGATIVEEAVLEDSEVGNSKLPRVPNRDASNKRSHVLEEAPALTSQPLREEDSPIGRPEGQHRKVGGSGIMPPNIERYSTSNDHEKNQNSVQIQTKGASREATTDEQKSIAKRECYSAFAAEAEADRKIESVKFTPNDEADLDNSSLTADEVQGLDPGENDSDSSLLVSPSPTPLSFVVQSQHGPETHYLPALPQQAFSYPVQFLPSGIPPVPQSILTAPQVVPHGRPSGGRRKIRLRLQEEVVEPTRQGSFFSRSSRFLRSSQLQSVQEITVDRGSITVSWFEGTTSTELQEHVRRMVIREMGLHRDTELSEMRIIDETMDPPEEIVLSPFIPDGSKFLLKYSMKKDSEADQIHKIQSSTVPTAPDSPSTSPSPFPSSSDLNARLLAGRLEGLQPTLRRPKLGSAPDGDSKSDEGGRGERRDITARAAKDSDSADVASRGSDLNDSHVMGYNPEDQVEARLHELADLLIVDRRARKRFSARRQREKRQVIFVLANYFVLFLSLIAISAEIQARAPKWLTWVELQLENVQKCATDQDALFECVSKGDFSGLVASLILWVSRSAATKRFFLFGFESPKRLWTVVYESLVTAVCWGTSYMFIRRGMNPDTRSNFWRKYWKDAVYGSLAGFNASFMKQVLKNLIPQEALEDALQERQLKILSWLPTFN